MPNITKAVILARGLGTRMRSAVAAAVLSQEQQKAADSGLKGLINVGRPFIEYVISALADAGITDICLVVGPGHNYFAEHFSALNLSRVTLHYAIQTEPLGTADAVAAAAEFAGSDMFLVLNSDNYYPAVALRKLTELSEPGLIGFSRRGLIEQSNIPAEKIAAFAVVQVNSDNKLQRIVEKPSAEVMADWGKSAAVSMNAWVFDSHIFNAAGAIEKSVRGEYELTSAVNYLLEQGQSFQVCPVEGAVLDMSARTDIKSVEEALSNVAVAL